MADKFELKYHHKDLRKLAERNLIRLIAVLVIVSATIACILGFTYYKQRNLNSDIPLDNEDICSTSSCVHTAYGVISIMNQTVDPCEDFYEYACGNWKVENPMPSNKARYITFDKLRDEVKDKLRDLLAEPLNNEEAVSIKNSKRMYKSCMDTKKIASLGNSPLLDTIKDKFKAWPLLKGKTYIYRESLEWVLAGTSMMNHDAFFSRWVGSDYKNNKQNIIQIDQPYLILSSPDYYLAEQHNDTMSAYRLYADRIVAKLGGGKMARNDIQRVIDLEVQLAGILTPDSERRDDSKLYNKMTLSDLYKRSDFLEWREYFQFQFQLNQIIIDDNEEVVVLGLDYLRKLAILKRKTHKRVLINYAIWKFVVSTISLLPEVNFGAIKQDFNFATRGTSTSSPRYHECSSRTTDAFGLAVGRLFVDRFFPAESKRNAITMIKNMKLSFQSMLKEATWMQKSTQMKAIEKVQAVKEKIGYPDFILDDLLLDKEYSTLKPNTSLFFDNVMQVWRQWNVDNLNQLRKPVDNDKWGLAPSVVNAYYTPTRNQIAFPAAILQPPFYSKNFPNSINYGGIGIVIGHEITHGFDDQGRLYGPHGNMKQWMADEDVVKYKERASCLIDQYNGYLVKQINQYVHGNTTLGENIADNGGVKESYRAYRNLIKERMYEEPRLPGLELHNNQLFFLGFAQVWCGEITDKKLEKQLKTDPHSPGKFRVIGALSNSDDFSKAFKCRVNSRMNPTKKCNLW